MAKPLAGQVAVVTGAGRNIGRAEALALAEAGASVLVNSLDNAEATAQTIREAGGRAEANTTSASSWQGGKEIIEAAVDSFGRVDILINNAGIVSPRPIQEMTEAEWDEVVNVSLKGYAATIRHAAPHFIAQGSGTIINTGSTSGLGHLHMANYSAAKEGALGLTRSVARDLGQYGVRCNLIRPINFVTATATEGVQQSSELSRELGFPTNGTRYLVHHPESITPLGEHVAALALLLCLPETEEVSGQDFYIKGDEVGRFREPELSATQFKPDGWTTEALREPGVFDNLVGDIRNRYVHRGRK